MRVSILIAAIVLISCETPEVEEIPKELQEIDSQLKNIPIGRYTIVEIDGCEYIVFKDRIDANESFGLMTHKGNCKNPIHCYNK